MIVVSAFFRAREGREAELEAALLGMIPHVQDEAGAVVYALHRSRVRAGHFFFYEKYTDQAAVDAHMSKPYLKALLDVIEPLLAAPLEVDLHEEVGSIVR